MTEAQMQKRWDDWSAAPGNADRVVAAYHSGDFKKELARLFKAAIAVAHGLRGHTGERQRALAGHRLLEEFHGVRTPTELLARRPTYSRAVQPIRLMPAAEWTCWM